MYARMNTLDINEARGGARHVFENAESEDYCSNSKMAANMKLENKTRSKLLIIELLTIELSHSQSIFCCEPHSEHCRLWYRKWHAYADHKMDTDALKALVLHSFHTCHRLHILCYWGREHTAAFRHLKGGHHAAAGRMVSLEQKTRYRLCFSCQISLFPSFDFITSCFFLNPYLDSLFQFLHLYFFISAGSER